MCIRDRFTSINHLAEMYDMPILYSCHPRSRKFLQQRGFVLDKRVRLHEPLGFHDYNHLQMNAFCVVSDSGTLPEEASFFTSVGHPFPAVCIRTSTEPVSYTHLLAGEHQHVQRVSVVGIGAGDQPVVGRVMGRGIKDAVQNDMACLLIQLIFFL